MAVRKIDRSWWVDFTFKHVRYRKRSPQNSKAGAELYEVTLRQRIASGTPIDNGPTEAQRQQTFEEFAWKWFDEYVVTNNKYSEQRSKRYVLKSSLIPFFGKIPVGQITAYHTEQFKAQWVNKGVSNKTIKNHLTVLNKCLGTAYEWLQLAGAPPKIKWPKCSPARTSFLSPDECELLLRHAEGLVREMILVALRTGMRQGELKGLQWSSIDWDNRMITVRHSRDDRMKMLVPPKSNRERHLPLHIDAYEALVKRKGQTGYVFLDADRQPFDYHRMERRLTRVCESASLRKIGWHTLRHTFASHLAKEGVPLIAVQQLMGHSNIATTMRYAHLAPSVLREAIDMLAPRNRVDADFGQPVVNRWLQTQRQGITPKNVAEKYL